MPINKPDPDVVELWNGRNSLRFYKVESTIRDTYNRLVVGSLQMTYILGMTLVEIWDPQEGLPLLEEPHKVVLVPPVYCWSTVLHGEAIRGC